MSRLFYALDSDNDGVEDVDDNCPYIANHMQVDSDEDTLGNVCDNCDYIFNTDQADIDDDHIGDVCDICPYYYNPGQIDNDNPAPDGVGDQCDNCPYHENSDQTNSDNDELGDACDNCPFDDNPNLIIKAGFACGWGLGEDSLKISRSEIKYIYYVPAESLQPKIKETRDVTESEWLEIENAVNIDAFLKLNYNSCNICVDGCDEWISIQSDRVNHSIRYSKGLQIESIEKLQNIIAQIKSEFH